MDTHKSGITQDCTNNATDCCDPKHDLKSPSHVEEQLPVATRATERRLRTKIDFAICPIVCSLYLFCYIDRANIGGINYPTRPLTV